MLRWRVGIGRGPGTCSVRLWNAKRRRKGFSAWEKLCGGWETSTGRLDIVNAPTPLSGGAPSRSKHFWQLHGCGSRGNRTEEMTWSTASRGGKGDSRTSHHWGERPAVDGHTKEIEGSGEVTTPTFTFRTDWPADVGGADSGPTR